MTQRPSSQQIYSTIPKALKQIVEDARSGHIPWMENQDAFFTQFDQLMTYMLQPSEFQSNRDCNDIQRQKIYERYLALKNDPGLEA